MRADMWSLEFVMLLLVLAESLLALDLLRSTDSGASAIQQINSKENILTLRIEHTSTLKLSVRLFFLVQFIK